MTRFLTITAKYALLVTLCVLAGCVKVRQTVTVMPDGSGKAELYFALNKKLIDLARQNEEDPFKEVVPGAMKDKTTGIVAFTEPKRTPGDDFSSMTYTVYFRDINKLSIQGLGEENATQFSYTREGEGATLTVSQGPAISKLTKYEPTPEKERAKVRESMAGLMFSEHYILPGSVNPAVGLTTADNTAQLDITLEDLLEGKGAVPKLKGKKSITLVIPKVEEDPAAIQAFKQEIEAAIADEKARKKKAQLDL